LVYRNEKNKTAKKIIAIALVFTAFQKMQNSSVIKDKYFFQDIIAAADHTLDFDTFSD